MQIKFWGVRGSIAVPNRRMLRYGVGDRRGQSITI
jgi:hypothetical protein